MTNSGFIYAGVSLRFEVGGHLDWQPGKFGQSLKNFENL